MWTLWEPKKIPSLNVCLFVKLGVGLSKKVAHESFCKMRISKGAPPPKKSLL